MKLLANILVYQVCWLACILGGANGLPLAGVAVVALAVAWHLYLADSPRVELALLGLAGVVGAIWDSLLVAAGWLVYPSGTLIDGTAPYWIVALWVGFATTFNVSLRYFKRRLWLATLLGAVGGPLAFLAGERLGGVVFTDTTVAMLALGLGWATLMPLMMLAARRLNGFRDEVLPAVAMAGH